MKLEAPEAFFLRNGGAALLEANGIDVSEGLAGLFSARHPNWPKEDGSVSVTRMGTNNQNGILLVCEGRLELRSAARPAHPGTDGIVIAKGMAGRNMDRFLCGCMDLPRPFLLLAVGGSYQAAVDGACLTIDPRLVECNGTLSFVLDRDRVEDITAYADHFGVSPGALRLLKLSLEQGMLFRGQRDSTVVGKVVRHPAHRLAVSQACRAMGIQDLDLADPHPDHVGEVKRYWADIARLPASGDFAWTAAQLASEAPAASEAA